MDNSYVDQPDKEFYALRLFVSGTSPNSVRAINNLTLICESNLKDRYELEIIDIHQQPQLVKNEDVAAVPMLIKYLPLPKRRLVGDMSERDKVLKGLGLL
ncbi:MAG: circadian clock KaiB family protein [Bacteroidota bacterium]